MTVVEIETVFHYMHNLIIHKNERVTISCMFVMIMVWILYITTSVIYVCEHGFQFEYRITKS